MQTTVRPVTPDRWDDLVTLFGDNGAYAGCWCLWWRQTTAAYEAERGDGNRRALHRLVEDGEVPGLLAYRDGQPVGWVSVGPRPAFGRVRRSPLFRPDDPDDPSVWSVVCFYVPRPHRQHGLATDLLAAAVSHAAREGGAAVEGYPVVPEGARDADLFPGVPSVFSRLGFAEVAAPSARRRVLRRDLLATPVPRVPTVTVRGPDVVAVLELPGTTPTAALQCFVDPAEVRRWWGGELAFDPVVQGRYAVHFPQLGQTLQGTVVTYEPAARLAFSWRWAHEPDAPARTVDIEVASTSDGARLVLRHGPHGDDPAGVGARQEHLDGWRFFLPRLAGTP